VPPDENSSSAIGSEDSSPTEALEPAMASLSQRCVIRVT
jgi:hypothetical protein